MHPYEDARQPLGSGSTVSSLGRICPARPRMLDTAIAVSGVDSGFTSTTTPPDSLVRRGNEAAGCTSPLVPTTRQTSALSALSIACRRISGSRPSPNQTTSGRSSAAHLPHRGKEASPLASTGWRSEVRSSHPVQRVRKRDPWSRMGAARAVESPGKFPSDTASSRANS